MTTFAGEIHPYADMFPMLPDADLDALAADISSNGQRHPILLTVDGVLVDGRNRLEACKRAGVPPKFRTIDADPVAVIIAENMQRRDLTQGQKAHLAVAAEQCSESEHSVRQLARITGVAVGAIAEARVIAEYAPEQVPLVISGQALHASAYATAKENKLRQQQEARQRQELADHAPDLLDQVPDTLTLAMAYAAYQERDRERLEQERHWQKTVTGRQEYITWTLELLANTARHDAQRAITDAVDWSTIDTTLFDDAFEGLTYWHTQSKEKRP
jgi:ParB-like chromosome segregation protein Spo0J